MAQLEIYPVPLYNPLHPYHWEYDNLPLEALKLRDEAINGEVERCTQILRDAIGTQGTLSNRLNQSIQANGDLKSSAIDQALHNVAEHADGVKTLTSDEIDDYIALGYVVSNPVSFVRMLDAERDKLSLIADEATNLSISVETPSTTVYIDEGVIRLQGSPTVSWDVQTGNIVTANLGFPPEAAHRHYYGIEPVTSDYQNYETTSISTPFVEGSLRVYINGMRLSSDYDVYIPGNLVSDTWTLNKFTPDHESGTFELASSITADDVIVIDFDVSLS